jgi:hypothetical protein
MAVKGVISMDRRVKDVMTTDVVSVRETAEYKDIVAVLRELHVSAFPVLDEAGHLVGVVSAADLLLKEIGQEALGGHLISAGRRGELRAFDRPDSEIRNAVRKDIIAGDFALDPDAFDVQVTSGIVTITGQVETQALAQHLLGALRHAEGVVGVRSRLRFPPPDPSKGVVWLRPPQHR